MGPRIEATIVRGMRYNYFEITINGVHHSYTATLDPPETINGYEVSWKRFTNAPSNHEGNVIHTDNCHIMNCQGCQRHILCDCGAWDL